MTTLPNFKNTINKIFSPPPQMVPRIRSYAGESEELDKYFSKDDQEDSKPISDILDSFNLEELKVEDEIVDIHEEEVIINDQ